ncbi:uncharacterized protein G2W53_035380 [Senna tora]|uniref:Uncharacterized protein n=1 Tax=Senna tora TaxID=362788 RepID=A0A834SVN5_9FABA|nr:uncharacterized protein G2W53_035380 [Senna tora]
MSHEERGKEKTVEAGFNNEQVFDSVFVFVNLSLLQWPSLFGAEQHWMVGLHLPDKHPPEMLT